MRVLGMSVPVCECPHLYAPVSLTCVALRLFSYTSTCTSHGCPAYWPPLEHVCVRAGVHFQLPMFRVNPCDLRPQTSPIKLGCGSYRDPMPQQVYLNHSFCSHVGGAHGAIQLFPFPALSPAQVAQVLLG